MLNRLKSSLFYRQTRIKTREFYNFLQKFLNDWSLVFSAVLAYNLLIALVPIAVAFFGIFGLILKNHSNAEETIKRKIVDGISSDNRTIAGIQQIVDSAFDRLSKDAGLILIIGILFAIFGASRLFITIENCFSIIYRLPERGLIRQNLLAFGMLFFFIFLIPLMIIVNSLPSFFLQFIPGDFGRFGTWLGGVLVSLFISFVLFESIYLLIPNKKMTWKNTWCGALVASLALEIFLILFPFYLQSSMDNYAGQIGFVVLLLLFFYYFSTILLLGAQVNAFFYEDYRSFFNGLGTYLSHMHSQYGVDDPQKPFVDDETEM